MMALMKTQGASKDVMFDMMSTGRLCWSQGVVRRRMNTVYKRGSYTFRDMT